MESKIVQFLSLLFVELADESLPAGELQRIVHAVMQSIVEKDEVSCDPLGTFSKMLTIEVIRFLDSPSGEP